MHIPLLIRVSVAIFCGFAWIGALAGTADFSGRWSYRVSGDSVTIEVDRITNNSTSRTTGTLYLTLRYTTGSSPSSTGYTVARRSLSYINGDGRLPPGNNFNNIRLTTDFTSPGAGTYYVHLFVSEYPDLDTVLDVSTASSTTMIGDSGAGSVDFSGRWSYRVSGDSVTIEVDRITNNSTSRTTGTLYLTLRYTTGSSPSSTGYTVARRSLSYINGDGRLPPGNNFNNIRLTTDFTSPGAGTYYVHLFVSEYPDLDTVLDVSTASSTTMIGDSGAGSVDFSGRWSYRVSGDSVTIEVDRITNNSTSRTTGTLYLTLRYTTGSSPSSTGYTVARRSLSYINGDGRLPPGNNFNNIRLTTDFTSPGAGTYYVHLFVSEYPDLDTVLDVSTASSTTMIGDSGAGSVDFSGRWSYRVSGDSVTIEVDRITNNSTSRTTGTLYLTLRYTTGSSPSSTGYTVARRSLSYINGDGRLPPGNNFNNIRLTTDFTSPGAGTYYVHLFVSEYPDLDTVLDVETASNTVSVAGREGNDTRSGASTIGVNTSATGSISEQGDVDYWRFEVLSHGSLVVETTGGTDTVGVLEDRLGTLIEEDDDSADPNFRIEVTLDPGVYYIRVTGYSNETGPYTLHVHHTPSVGPGREEGRSGVQALGDLNGDGRDDVLLRHTDGRWYYYPMRGRGNIAGQRGVASLTRDLDWRLAGIGDLNGDGRDDVLLRHTDGRWYYYPMSGRGNIAGQRGVASLTRDLDWRLAGIGDLNGDGRDDVLLRHTDGRWYYYPMSGRRNIAGERGVASLTRDLDWRLAGIGDLNGDGRDDVLLRHTDGRWYYYPMSGRGNITGQRGTASLTRDLDWRLAGIGDLNGDGRDDVLLRHTDGRWYYYPMSGRRNIAGQRGVASLTRDLDWRLAGIGDLNGDGRDDVLLRHTDGRWYYYPMSGRGNIAGQRGVASLTRDLDWMIPGGLYDDISGTPSGEPFRDPLASGGQGPEMAIIQAGRFQMGCVSDMDCGSDQMPVHGVSIPRAFALSKYEVTFANWEACVNAGSCDGYRPDDRGWGRGNRPVINVALLDAQEYVQWLSSETGENYRLPSEAEWEYAVRSGSSTKYSWGNDVGRNRANCWNEECGDEFEFTAPVGSFPANPWGLHDMHGNVAELTQDCSNSSYDGAPSDGSAWEKGDCEMRVARGGSYVDLARFIRSADRLNVDSGFRSDRLGFRVAREV